jgi:uncharacterized surface protein with fasciclin (FAS1) repeats
MLNTRTGQIAAAALAFLLVSGAGKAAMAESVASALQSNPEFSDYVSEAKVAGLWHTLEHAKAITIFAPTNEAFAPYGKNWRAHLFQDSLQERGTSDMFHSEHQTFVESSIVPGTHPEHAFRGKVTRVRSVSGYYFTVDGTHPGKLVINPQLASMDATIGFTPPKDKTTKAGAPIAADNGVIYPTDGLPTRYDAQP